MDVDPVALKTFADRVDLAGTAITDANLGAVAACGCDSIAGSTSQWAAKLVGAHLGVLVHGHATSVDMMGLAVRGAGDSFVVTDDDLAEDFAALWKA
ncbi:hypothetical protein [Williamsia soli]|uniref:hypothetical protein n=1 Tax=Williamsia soli TaxID=364929 RepID=UPI001A9E2CA3|nr:hypothetical protein [Williamsia soli]